MNKAIKLVGITLLAAIAIACVFLYVPLRQSRIISRGIDSFDTHRALYGNHTFRQGVISQGHVLGGGAILVDLFRSNEVTPVTVKLLDGNSGDVLAEAVIPPENIQDDDFAFFTLDRPVAAPRTMVFFEFSVPEASRENAIGVRFDPDAQIPGTQRFENENIQEGIFAVQLIERVPLWRYIHTAVVNNRERFDDIAIALSAAVVIGLLALRPGWRGRPKHIRTAVELGIVLCIAALALNASLWVIPQKGGVSGGDPYNYLFITKSITELDNPFAGVKRLPGYPILLLPSYLTETINDQTYMRTLSATAGAASLVFVMFLARSLRLPWAVQLGAVALLASQKDFFWTAMRPEPYTVYTMLLLLSLWLFFAAKKPWQQMLFGIVLGYAAMTRQEGFVLAIILFTCHLIQEINLLWRMREDSKFPISNFQFPKILRLYLPAFLLVLPFFIHNTLEYGNPIFTPYFEGERLQIVDSYNMFLDSSHATWGIIGSMWKPEWSQLERYEPANPFYLAAVFGSIGWWVLSRLPWIRRPAATALIGMIATGLLLLTGWVFTADVAAFRATVPLAIAGGISIAAIPFLGQTSWRGALVLAVLASQVLIALWFHPFPKHYQQSYPLITLMLAATLFATPAALIAAGKRNITRSTASALAVIALLFPFFLTSVLLYRNINPAIDNFNAGVALDSVTFRAAQAARALPGLVGFDQEYLPARLYFESTAVYFPSEENPSIEFEDAWLATEKPQFIVSTNANRVFEQPRPDWEVVDRFLSEGEDERLFESVIYRLP